MKKLTFAKRKFSIRYIEQRFILCKNIYIYCIIMQTRSKLLFQSISNSFNTLLSHPCRYRFKKLFLINVD